MNDFLDEKRREITQRLKELKPVVDEFRRLEAAVAALAGLGSRSAATATTTRRRGPGRPPGTGAKRAVTARKAAAKPATTRRRGPGRPPGTGAKRTVTATKAAAKRRAGRRKGSGARAAQALSLVQGQPGITIPELAAKMSIKQNYLYRVLPGLEQENKVEKKGRGWYPKG